MGSPFPLPVLGKPLAADLLKRLLDAGIRSFNQLASGYFDRTSFPILKLTSVQKWMLGESGFIV